MSSLKAFVGVKTRYYKYEEARLVLDHVIASRNGFTKSANVHSSLSSKNIGVLTKGCKTPIEALDRACSRYKQVTGKKVRSDFNVLFDHVVVLSESQYAKLEIAWGEEKAKRQVLSHMIKYADKIKEEYGFLPISVQLHLDEGHFEEKQLEEQRLNDGQLEEEQLGPSRQFVRNIHCHCSFMNYDFKKKISPLRGLMGKGKNRAGQTNSLNMHFVRMQDIAAEVFAPLKFERGVSKDVTGAKHLEKEAFVRAKLNEMGVTLNQSEQKVASLQQEVKHFKKRAKTLSNEVNMLQQKRDWLSNRIEELQEHMQNLEQAVIRNCRHAVAHVHDKVSNLLNLSKPSM